MLKTYLCAYCSYQQDNWINYLSLAKFCFNNYENSSTHQMLFFANVAYHPSWEPHLTESLTIPATDKLMTQLEQIHTELHTELEHA